MTPLRHRDDLDDAPPPDRDHDTTPPTGPLRGKCDDPWQTPTDAKEPW